MLERYGTAATFILASFLVYALVMFGASFAGFAGEAPMILSGIAGLVLWGALSGLLIYALRLAWNVRRGDESRLGESHAWTSALLLVTGILSLVTAVALAPGAFASCGPLFLASLYHWIGLVGAAAAFVAWFTLPLFARDELGTRAGISEPRALRTLLILGGVVYGIIGAFWLGAWLLLRGSIDTGDYPTASSSLYRLPYPDGERAWVIQGNNSHFNHTDDEQHAWDFRRRCGSPVLAARAGTVTRVIDTNSGNGKGKPNNLVEVRHDDGTLGRYLHISKGSAKVTPGATVQQGDTLAEVGNVGNSLTGHIHFVVERGTDSIPVAFHDVDEDSGIPRTFERYASAD